MDTFPLGGISKSLLALFNEIGYKYEIDLFLFKKEGLFIPLIPENVNLIESPLELIFRNPHPRNVFQAFKILSWKKWFKWLQYSFKCSWGKITGGLHKQNQKMDEWIGKKTPPLEKHYDAAIAYQGGRCIYYLINNIKADTKIGYVHSDYEISEMDYMLYPVDKRYFPKLDLIVTVSENCKRSLDKRFPELKERIKVIENICSVKMIRELSKQKVDFDSGFKGLRLLTMGRMDISTKGIDLAISATKILKEKGYDFRWYFLGDGSERKRVEELIENAGVGENFILLGSKTNPYPYIAKCDIYVQPSRFEGKSVALDEVKALAKPVVVTRFTTVNDQFEDSKTAVIADIEAEDIAKKIKILINDEGKKKTLSENLLKEKVGNEEQALIFESLLDTTSRI